VGSDTYLVHSGLELERVGREIFESRIITDKLRGVYEKSTAYLRMLKLTQYRVKQLVRHAINKYVLADPDVPDLSLFDQLLEFLPGRVRVFGQIFIVRLAVLSRKGPLGHEEHELAPG
jgi:hypothetical protein